MWKSLKNVQNCFCLHLARNVNKRVTARHASAQCGPHRATFKTKTRRLFEWLSKHCDWPTFVSQEITNTPAGLKSIKVWPGSLSLLKEGVMGLPCAEPGRGAKWSIRMDSRPVRVRFRIRRCMSPWPPNPRYQLPETIWCSESEKYCASCKIL